MNDLKYFENKLIIAYKRSKDQKLTEEEFFSQIEEIFFKYFNQEKNFILRHSSQKSYSFEIKIDFEDCFLTENEAKHFMNKIADKHFNNYIKVSFGYDRFNIGSVMVNLTW